MFKAGLSCVDITPPVGMVMDGFAARQPSVLGVHDSLKATALVASDAKTTAAIISCDLLNLDASLVRDIRQETNRKTGIHEGHITVSCTHTHYGPAVSDLNAFYAGTDDAVTYRAGLKYYLAGAVHEAFTRMQEATLGVGWGTSIIGVNRRQRVADGRIVLGQDPSKPIDRQVGVAKFQSLGGESFICLANFACHPVSQTWEMRHVSADYPGRVRDVVETLTGARCMFLQGACGNINPVQKQHSYEPARKLGTQLGCEVVKVWEDIQTAPVDSLVIASETIVIPRYDYGSAEKAQMFVQNLEKEVEKWRAEGAVEGLINWTLMRHKRALEAFRSWTTGKPMLSLDAEIQAWAVGDLGIVFVPGEVFNEIGAEVKKHSPFSHTFFVGYSNGNIGYVPIPEAYAEGGYEVDDACQVGPEASGLVTDKSLELLERLYDKA